VSSPADVPTQPCPGCGAALEPRPQWASWCAHCEWNLLPKSEAVPQSRWLEWRRQLGARLALRLFSDLSKEPVESGHRRGLRWSPSLLLAFTIAGLVHGASLAFAVWGLYVLFAPWTNPFAVFGAAVALLLAWLSWPRRAEPPDRIVARTEFPNLYALADKAAAAMGAPAADGIAVSKDFGANYRVCGLTGKRFIELGLPLLAILTPQERVALIAHELSHGANGDPLRGQFLFGAVEALAQWANAIRPLSIGSSGDGMSYGPIISLFAIPFELALLALSEVLLALAMGVLLLVLRESQRAEYLADRLAASVSGARAMQTALEKTYLHDTIEAAVRRMALTGSEAPLEQVLLEAARSLPESELERQRRISRRLNWQVDSTHPPTAMRIEMLSLRPVEGKGELSMDPQLHAIDAELAALMPTVRRELVDHCIEQSYG
jgi:heat shock protein HtpX